MVNIIVAFPKMEHGKSIKNLLVRSGFSTVTICTTGAAVLSSADGLSSGIIICGYKLQDMIYHEIKADMPERFSFILMASRQNLNECNDSDIITLEMPLKVQELLEIVESTSQMIERRRKKERNLPKKRVEQDKELIQKAKSFLMEYKNMLEEEAYRYIQKLSMDSSTNMVETAQKILMMYNKPEMEG
ncbi:MAG: ANTAR domain-containing response regulator [Lachnospiraceae bacterium]